MSDLDNRPEYVEVQVGGETWRVLPGSIAEGMAHYAAARLTVTVVPARLSDQDWNRAVDYHRDVHVPVCGDIPVRLCQERECKDAYRAYTWGAALDCCKVWRASR
jgi:hypothetical protein